MNNAVNFGNVFDHLCCSFYKFAQRDIIKNKPFTL